MSNENFAEKMKAAKEAKKAKEKVELKAGDIIETDKGESFELDAEQAASINAQIADEEKEEKFDEKISEVIENLPTKINSVEFQVISSEFNNFGIVLFEKDKPVFLTEKVLQELKKLPNFNDLVDKGVIKIGV